MCVCVCVCVYVFVFACVAVQHFNNLFKKDTGSTPKTEKMIHEIESDMSKVTNEDPNLISCSLTIGKCSKKYAPSLKILQW